MVRIELVRDKIRRLRATLARLHGCLPGEASSLAADRDRLDLVSFRVYLAVQEAVDLASHAIADEGWGPASSLREHFAILAQQRVIDPELAAKLSASVKVRNVVAHAYSTVDPDKLHAAAVALDAVGESYCAQFLAWAERAGAGAP